jgi:hypothetical protein
MDKASLQEYTSGKFITAQPNMYTRRKIDSDWDQQRARTWIARMDLLSAGVLHGVVPAQHLLVRPRRVPFL